MSHKIPHSCPERYGSGQSGPRGDGRYNAREVAEMLGCDVVTVSKLCGGRKLDCIRSTPRSPWWIKLDLVNINKLKQEIQSRRPGKKTPSKSANGGASARRKRGHHETAVS